MAVIVLVMVFVASDAVAVADALMGHIDISDLSDDDAPAPQEESESKGDSEEKEKSEYVLVRLDTKDIDLLAGAAADVQSELTDSDHIERIFRPPIVARA